MKCHKVKENVLVLLLITVIIRQINISLIYDTAPFRIFRKVNYQSL